MPAPSSVMTILRRPPPSVNTSIRLRAGVDRVLDQLLHHARRTFHHLAGGDAVDDLFGELADRHGRNLVQRAGNCMVGWCVTHGFFLEGEGRLA